MCAHPTPADVAAAVEGKAAVTPSELWGRLTSSYEDGAPRWVYETLRRLGYGPRPEGFWWRNDLPAEKCERLAGFYRHLDEVYPDDD